MVGRTLSHYQVVEKLGAGGMGEVYRARDTKLARDVAIKVLPEAFARDPERLARFEREAQLLASLNHPNIAAIYGLEESDGLRFLVLELVPGETLSGPLPVEEALRICRQIAEALEAAHEKGIVHRDLKPGNVKVTPEGKVKVLDFGLAKAFAGDSSMMNLSHSPTLTAGATREGVILGTAAYMSPEQARGKPLDRRTDIWAFGCVLYEALTGRRAFGDETISDTLVTILKSDPDWNALPAATPPRIRELLRRCLQKDTAHRLQHIGDARLEIEEGRGETLPGVSPQPRSRRMLPWALAALMAVAAAAFAVLWSFNRARPLPQVSRLTLSIPPGASLVAAEVPGVAVSPDGTRVVYVGSRGGTKQLYLRPLDRLEATPIAGTEGASIPFFSPDGQWLGFFARGKLKKVAITGGAPLPLCDATDSRGASWGPDDMIVFQPSAGAGLSRISAAGGAPQVLTTRSMEERGSHRWPEVLPGGKAVLFTIWRGGVDQSRIAVLSLATGKWQVIVEAGTYPRYSPTGHLVYASSAGLLAVPFDLQRLQVTGSPVPILEGVLAHYGTGAAHFSFSRTGSLAYVPGLANQADRALFWVDRKGVTRPITGTHRPFGFPRLSPDGRRLTIMVTGPSTDLWVHDIARDTLSRLTFEPQSIGQAIWTPDGKRVVFCSNRNGPANLFWKPADGSSAEERLTTSENVQFASSFSPDGRFLAFHQVNSKTGFDIWVLPMDGERKPRPFIETPFNEYGAVFSPDGRWLAYQSDESGQSQVYIQPFPGPGGKWQISTDGGTAPMWARNGRELFYRNGDKMMAAAIQTQPGFVAEKPRELFEGHYEPAGPFGANYDVAPDGQRFVMVKSPQESGPTQVNVVLNWFEDLRRR